ncbi:MAG: hypothetical protein PHQ89_00055 [Bacilli bacterium]|nr:hypothetical protein [Bacilli bacterium]
MNDNFIVSDPLQVNIRFLNSDGFSGGSSFCLEEFKSTIFCNYIYEHYFKTNRVIGVFISDLNNRSNNKNILVGKEVSLKEIIKDSNQYDWNRMEKIIADFREESASSRFCIPEFQYYKNNPNIKKFIYILSQDDEILENKSQLWDNFAKIILFYGEYTINNSGLVKKNIFNKKGYRDAIFFY